MEYPTCYVAYKIVDDKLIATNNVFVDDENIEKRIRGFYGRSVKIVKYEFGDDIYVTKGNKRFILIRRQMH